FIVELGIPDESTHFRSVIDQIEQGYRVGGCQVDFVPIGTGPGTVSIKSGFRIVNGLSGVIVYCTSNGSAIRKRVFCIRATGVQFQTKVIIQQRRSQIQGSGRSLEFIPSYNAIVVRITNRSTKWDSPQRTPGT